MGDTLTIGRNDSNTIVIDNLAVSGTHARVDSVSATYILTDLESTNGTFVNGDLVSSHTLRNNDVILIGKHELVFDKSDIEKVQQEVEELREEEITRYLDTAEYRALINKASGNPSAPKRTMSAPPEHIEKTGFFSKIWKAIFG